jgi:predicted nucleic acid-binding protein
VKFWDSSALITLLFDEPRSGDTLAIAREDEGIAVWWGSPVECFSAFARMRREGKLALDAEELLRSSLSRLEHSWIEIEPTADLRSLAGRILFTHPLRAADSLQLAAALTWAGGRAAGGEFVCLDERLRLAARMEGFAVLPVGS